MVFERDKPVCDGIQFDDVFGAPKALRDLLYARGLVWMTAFKDERGTTWSGSVVAATQADAEKIADARGLDEKVLCVMPEAPN